MYSFILMLEFLVNFAFSFALIMNYPLFIARRLSLSAGGRKKAPAVAVAVAAVALSVAVMMASVAIVLGFKKEIRDKVVGFNGHITLYASPSTPDEENIVTMTPSLKKELESLPYVIDFSLQAAIPAILKTGSDFKGVYMKGLADKATERFISRNMEQGKVVDFLNPDNKNKIVVSANAARQLDLHVGDKIDTYFISDELRVRRLEITGIFNTHFNQYDDLLIYGSLPLVQQMGQIDSDQGTYIQVFTDDFDKIDDYTIRLQQKLNEAVADGRIYRFYKTDNVLSQGIGYFSWLSLLDTNVVVVLVLMMIVGCITLISGMLIIIIEKKKFIGTMKALGAPTGKVRRVFVYLAVRIALWGILIGNLIMVTLLLVQEKTHIVPLDAESYYIDFVPVSLSPLHIALLDVGVVVITYFVLILPSRFVARISPAETMRYE